jgi:hypothetical protein
MQNCAARLSLAFVLLGSFLSACGSPGIAAHTMTPGNRETCSAGHALVNGACAPTWVQEAYVKASNTGANDSFGVSVSLSADGSRLAVGAQLESSNATGALGDQANDSASNSGAVYVFARTGTAWSQEAYVKASNTGAGDHFGRSVSLTADGSRLAVGAVGEVSNATGALGDQANDSATNSGAVYVFDRRDD